MNTGHGSAVEMGIARKHGLTAVLSVLLALAGIHMAIFLKDVWSHSLQMDYAAMYTAGQSLNEGRSPYVNYRDSTPMLWDGYAPYRHSRYLYPPVVATLFRPLAEIPYYPSKILWGLISLAAAGVGFCLTARMIRLTPRDGVLLAGLFALLSLPFKFELERGQVDLLTFALIVAGMYAASRNGAGRQVVFGVCLALATVLKLHVIYFVPFLILRRNAWGVAGYAMGGLAIVGATLAFNGTAGFKDYLAHDLPRISRYGQAGPVEWMLPARTPAAVAAVPDFSKGGRPYLEQTFGVSANGTLVRIIQTTFKQIKFMPSPTLTSVTALLVALMTTAWLLWGQITSMDPLWRVTFWYLVMTEVLLTAPLTWTMNAVWLLPLPMIFAAWLKKKGRILAAPMIFAAAGLVLFISPQPFKGGRLFSYVMETRFVVAEILVAVALLGCLRRPLPSTDAARTSPVLL